VKAKSTVKIIIWCLALLAILAGSYQGLRFVQARKAAAQDSAKGQADAPLPKVVVAPVGRGDIHNVVSVTGEVRPLSSVDIVPKIPGHLERLRRPDGTPIEEGVTVEKGDVVAVIDREHLMAAVEAAEAALQMAQAAHETATVNLADARRERERWIKLREEGSGTQQQLEQVITAFDRAQAQLKQAEAQITQTRAALAQAKVSLNDATIASPFDAVVSRKYVDEGAFVGPTTAVVKLVDITQVEITGGVADRHYPLLQVGNTKAKVEVDAYPKEVFNGHVTRVRPELDTVTRTVAVTIRIPNEDGKLKPGMYARVTLILEERKDVLVVHDDALQTTGRQTRVFVVNDGNVHVRPVRIGLEEGTANEVLDGLKLGDRVVMRGQALLEEGMKVEAEEISTQ